jgi:hypothetical protein
MTKRNAIRKTMSMLLTGILASSILAFQVKAQSTGSAGAQAPSQAGAASATHAPSRQARYRGQSFRLPMRVQVYYGTVWGVEDLAVKAAESGELIRFSWRVVDADLAKTIHDKNLEPHLNDPEAGVQLVVPALENVGALRQMSTPIVGKSYWMAFSNPGRRVKPGHHVTVQIGPFQASGLVVQ